MKKENKEKLKNAPSASLEELCRRGLVDAFEHLKDRVDYNNEKVEDNAEQTDTRD
jgi:hypothetical protein